MAFLAKPTAEASIVAWRLGWLERDGLARWVTVILIGWQAMAQSIRLAVIRRLAAWRTVIVSRMTHRHDVTLTYAFVVRQYKRRISCFFSLLFKITTLPPLCHVYIFTEFCLVIFTYIEAGFTLGIFTRFL